MGGSERMSQIVNFSGCCFASSRFDASYRRGGCRGVTSGFGAFDYTQWELLAMAKY